MSDDGVYKVQNDFKQVDSTIQILNTSSRESESTIKGKVLCLLPVRLDYL